MLSRVIKRSRVNVFGLIYTRWVGIGSFNSSGIWRAVSFAAMIIGEANLTERWCNQNRRAESFTQRISAQSIRAAIYVIL